MSFLSKFFCCCRVNNPLDNCSENTLLWRSDKNNANNGQSNVFEKYEIRFYGLFEEGLKSKPFDVHLFSKSGIKKIRLGKNHTVFLFSKLTPKIILNA
jgi:hypothetical protein